MRLLAWAKTDTGKKRDHNEDSFLVAEDLGLFAVADGMGGHQGGEHASKLALQVLYQRVGEARADLDTAARAIERERREHIIERLNETEADTWGGNTPTSPLIDTVVPPALAVLRDSAKRASWAVFDAALASPHLRGMGTTLTAMFFVDDRLHICHAGDSRCYLLRDGTVRQLTEDHTWIAEQVKSGTMTEAEAKQSRYRHVITRSVGFERDVEMDTRTLAVEAGDCYVLCSDGLSNHLGPGELDRILGATWFRRAPQRLVDLANQRGGDDNCTVVVVMAANDASPP